MKYINPILYLILLFFGVLSTNKALALEPQKIYGAYVWGQKVFLNETHKWENGLWNTEEGQARIKELKKLGYACYRKNPTQFNCHWKSDHEELPTDIEKFAGDYVKNFVTGQPLRGRL